ncbi:HMG box domain-containing protein [Mycena indigotica]|uniref:HMG box domain-containing protein n=1 Tax=Mycena indigotica TaxID=2126181 RepID=A0A8H6SL24_9AGAR|nr:HMG box domain-containing protein [Mycena indigotica]KAF7301309.1 HMG box domain-containing protein [Mycena indigotica]
MSDSQRAQMAKGLHNAAATFKASHDSFAAAAAAMLECAKYAEQFADLVGGHEAGTVKRKSGAVEEVGEATNGKRKRATKKKDPNAPKRPASSYLLFQNEIRKPLKEKYPELNNTDLLNMIKTQWSDMSEEKKAVYTVKMQQLKEKYQQEKNAYDARSPEEVARADAQVAAALAEKKTRRRKSKVDKAAAPVSAPVIESSEEEEDEDEDEDDHPVAALVTATTDSSSSSEEEEEEEEEDDDEEEESPPPPPAKKPKVEKVEKIVEKDKKKKKSGKA